MENKHEELTQKYSTWGDKLLQHADVLHSIQKDKILKITCDGGAATGKSTGGKMISKRFKLKFFNVFSF